jgi:hypothetical protein
MPGRVVKVLVKDGDKVGGREGSGKGERRRRAHAGGIAAGMCGASEKRAPELQRVHSTDGPKCR